jgi:hypothetical protein
MILRQYLIDKSNVVLDLAKLSCGDASVDSRRVYGQPNREGQLPGDANAPLRPMNVGSWIYKGGLFAGNMPSFTNDQSGTARLQLYVPSGGAGTLRLATLSLFDLGSPSTTNGANLGVYIPSSSDANLNVAEGSVTWDSRWQSVQPQASPPVNYDYSIAPISTQNLTGAGGEYRNFYLYRPDSSPPTMAMSRLCVALTDENPNSGPSWRYFSSKEHQVDHSTFPLTDSAPRVWRLGEELATTWWLETSF